MNSKLIFIVLASFMASLHASSTESDADSVSSADSIESNFDSTSAPCTECPSLPKSKKHCKRSKRRIVTDRTCYTCPKYKCVDSKYVEGDKAKFCLKIMPTCSGKCDSDESCLVTVQTRYACAKAKCVSKYLNFKQLHDYTL